MTAASFAARIKGKEVPANWTGALTLDETHDLIRRAKIGDRAAFEDLYRAYVSFVYRYVASRVDRSRVEDTVAEVFVKALRNIAKFEFRGIEFSAWLIRIARNLIVDESKSAYRNREILSDSTPELYSTLEVESSAIASVEAGEISSALGRIRVEHRMVLELRFIKGLPSNEVARVMGKTEGAIRVLQFRALTALKRELGKTASHLLIRES